MNWGDKLVIAVAGGKGGVGKSCFVANFGTALAMFGRQVVLVDADIGAANLHTIIGVPYPAKTLEDFLQDRVPDLSGALVATPTPNLRLLSSASDFLAIASPDYRERQKLFRGIQKLSTEIIMFDISAGTHQRALDFFSLAPLGILILEPIPTSIENAFSFLKNLLLRSLLRLFYHDAETKRFIMHAIDPRHEGKILQFDQLLTSLEQIEGEKIARFRADFAEDKYKLGIVLNAVRDAQQYAIADKFTRIVKRYLGINVVTIGTLPYERYMDAAIVQRTPFIVKYPDSGYTQNMRKIAESLPSIVSGLNLGRSAAL